MFNPHKPASPFARMGRPGRSGFGQYGGNASPNGNAWGRQFMQQYGAPPGQMRNDWESFRQNGAQQSPYAGASYGGASPIPRPSSNQFAGQSFGSSFGSSYGAPQMPTSAPTPARQLPYSGTFGAEVPQYSPMGDAASPMMRPSGDMGGQSFGSYSGYTSPQFSFPTPGRTLPYYGLLGG